MLATAITERGPVMRPTALHPIAITLLAVGLGGCEMIGDIIQFGIGVGVVIAIVVIGVVWWLMRRFRGH